MKQNILKIFVLILAIGTLLSVWVNRSAARNAGADLVGPAGQEKTVEQVRKNIKVLTGMPDSQFIPVMNYFAASMGRRCNFCHVNNNGQWDYASDAKPEKNTAREMIKMVLDVNKSTFKGSTEVSCYTCHRGRNNPQSIPTLPLPVPSPPPANPGGPAANAAGAAGAAAAGQPQATPTPRPQLPAADDLLNKYTVAIGGQAAIDKIKNRVMKGTVTAANRMTGTYEIDQVAPDKGYEVFVTPRFTIEHGVNATSGWERNQQGVREIAGQELANARLSMQLFRNLRLKEQYTRLRVVGRDKVGDRDAYVVLAARSETEAERLYFDIETGLLLRRITYMRTIVGAIPEQTDFEDYRDVDGVKLPFTVRVSSVDAGNPYIVRTLTEIKLNTAIDESKFAMPAAPKP